MSSALKTKVKGLRSHCSQVEVKFILNLNLNLNLPMKDLWE